MGFSPVEGPGGVPLHRWGSDPGLGVMYNQQMPPPPAPPSGNPLMMVGLPPPVPEKQYELSSIRTPKPEKRALKGLVAGRVMSGARGHSRGQSRTKSADWI